MSVVADFTVPSSEFALGKTLQTIPDVDVEFERIVTHSQEWVMPFLWVQGEDLDAFDEAVRSDPTVDEATVTDDFGDVVLYQIKWSEEVERTVNAIFDQTGTLVEASGNGRSWDVRVRFNDHSSLRDLQDYFEEGGLDFTLQRVYTPTEPRQPEFNLTPEQRDALMWAAERGYFDVPRRVSLDELSQEFGLSTTSISERLHRGIDNLVHSTLMVGQSGTVEEVDDVSIRRSG